MKNKVISHIPPKANILDVQSVAVDWQDPEHETKFIDKVIAKVKDAADSPIMQYLPDLLLVTRAQFELLLHRTGRDWGLEEAFEGKKVYLFHTPYNIMEVQVGLFAEDRKHLLYL